ncbi:Crp/Fnr family transcriptional regulator [Thiococcus pfennigii]|jgi:CRP-like cAMP-binding protein|uniref:Crp/Fnr family transcriptional regulator n=1 Tax=Thiococcus pfennigii TaxID=1057 RepID=UPI0019042FB0|nr:Crp/Fnr family transcriptional regulator [Thiococcus pfennigii]MBK1700168.1 Crp/Fnr family transcriptional regulator [Thiococcus pfennigii]MBK1731733.1 Crp/Fnr family transcriptional regulator [Thiococcus pfennigii]
MSQVDKTNVLRASVLGTELDESEAQVLAERMGVLEVKGDELLVDEGEEQRTLFLLAAGRLCVCKTVGGVERRVYQMRPGECAGTRAFIDGSMRKAGLRAVGDCTVLTLEPEDFEALIESHPRLVYKVMRAIFRITHANLMRVNMESSELRNYVVRNGGRY